MKLYYSKRNKKKRKIFIPDLNEFSASLVSSNKKNNILNENVKAEQNLVPFKCLLRKMFKLKSI